MITHGDMPAIYFQGHRLADLRRGPNVRICGAFSTKRWVCSKVKNHRGPHVAHCTDDRGLPNEIVDVWFGETADSPPEQTGL